MNKIPVPEANENHDVFLNRCMQDTDMKEEYTDQTERAAQCHISWEKNKKASMKQEMIVKQFNLKALNDGEFVVMASDPSQDRDGDTIDPKGWDLRNFMANGAFLYGHDKDKLPVAKPISYEINPSGQLLIKGKWADKGTSEWTDAIRSLVEQEILKGVSVGFMGQSEARSTGRGRNYVQQELIECSFTPVPANANAKVLAKSFSPQIQEKLFENREEEEMIKMAMELREVIKAATIIEKSSIHVNRKAVAKAKSLVKAGKVNTGAWSISSDEENALLGKNEDWEAYSEWFLAIDTAATPKTKAYYKYPFGKDGEVYRRGIIAAKSRAAQQGEDAVSSAADSILQLIDKDKKENAFEEILTKVVNKEISASEGAKQCITIVSENYSIWIDEDEEPGEVEPTGDNQEDSDNADLLNQISSLIDSFTNNRTVSPVIDDNGNVEAEAQKQEETKAVEPAINPDAEEEAILNRIKQFSF